MTENHCPACGSIMDDYDIGVCSACKKEDIHSRNYNLGRNIDEKTEQFEKELKELCDKYGASMFTEVFDSNGQLIE